MPLSYEYNKHDRRDILRHAKALEGYAVGDVYILEETGKRREDILQYYAERFIHGWTDDDGIEHRGDKGCPGRNRTGAALHGTGNPGSRHGAQGLRRRGQAGRAHRQCRPHRQDRRRGRRGRMCRHHPQFRQHRRRLRCDLVHEGSRGRGCI